MVPIIFGFLLFPCALLAQGPNCTTTIDPLPDPPEGGYAFTSTTTCDTVIPDMMIGFDGWIGFSVGGGFGYCYNTKTCTIRDVLTCAYPGTYDVRGYRDIGGVRTYSAPIPTVVSGSAQLSVRFQSSQTPGYGRGFIDYSIPQQFYPHLIQVYVSVYPITLLTSGFVPISGTWEIPLDLAEGTELQIITGVQCNTDQGGYVTATVHLPGTIEFNVTDSAPESERRVLLSNLEPGYAYPHFQTIGGQDGMVPMYLRTRNGSGQLESGRTVYLRVLDPPDVAPYMSVPSVPAGKRPHDGDNEGPRATVEGAAISPGPGLPGASWQGTTGAGGQLDFALRLPQGAVGGDNYQIEASFDSAFPTGKTFKSGTLTAWKRVFIEKNKTLRNGIPLNADANPGSSVIHIADNHYRGNQGNRQIARGDRIVLVHAPALNRQNALDGWYLEQHNVGDVTRDATGYLVTLGTAQGNRVTPEPLLHAFGLDPSQRTRPELADWLGRLSVTTLSSADYFDAPEDLVTGSGSPFPDAFTEYIVLPAGPFGFVPMPHFVGYDQQILQAFAEKWCLSGAGTAAAPNHQLLVIGDNDGSAASDAGLTLTMVPNQISSFVWRGTIDANAGSGDANLWAAKTSAHELTHQWRTDAQFNLFDHCPQATPAYNSSTLYCLMVAPDAAAQAQRTNGIARFHMMTLPSGDVHSEYLEIRGYLDPFVP
jgi:hypothetical protein